MNEMLLTTLELSDSEFRRISDIVYEHCGINLHTGKRELVRARLAKRLRLGNFTNFRDYIKYVNEDTTGREFSLLIDTISTNLTSFFRENDHFKFLADTFLPSLMDKKRSNNDFRIRGWSAGCSSGEEPYSIAITLLKAIEGKGRWDIKVLATDISTKMLETAKKGIYSKERINPVPGLLQSKFLITHQTKGQHVYEVNDLLRQTIVFNYLNLMDKWPIKTNLDFIFCRNVMIYFDKPTQQKLIQRFWEQLEPGGILFTGHSESLTGIEHKFKYVKPTIYMKP